MPRLKARRALTALSLIVSAAFAYLALRLSTSAVCEQHSLRAVLVVALPATIALFALRGRRLARLLLRPLAALPGVSRDRTETGARNLLNGFVSSDSRASPSLSVLHDRVLAADRGVVPARAQGFDLDLGFEAGVLVVVATNLALIIPSGPAAIRVFEAATVAALAPFHVDRTTALSYGILLHALNALPFIFVGYVALHRHAAAVRRVEQRRPPPVGSPSEVEASMR